MEQTELLRRITTRLAELNLSAREACRRAGLGQDFIRDIRRRGHSPKANKLRALARVLRVPSTYLIEAVSPEPGIIEDATELTIAQLDVGYIVGNVEADAWRHSVEWPRNEWEAVQFKEERGEFQGARRFGLRVQGPSMDEYYPPGTILDCVSFVDIDRLPRAGDHVIVYRRGPGNLMETTVKELVRAGSGWELWPRSKHPAHQSPIPLPQLPGNDENEDIRIAALVIGSYHRRA